MSSYFVVLLKLCNIPEEWSVFNVSVTGSSEGPWRRQKVPGGRTTYAGRDRATSQWIRGESITVARERTADCWCEFVITEITSKPTLEILSVVFSSWQMWLDEWHVEDLEMYTSKERFYILLCEFTYSHPLRRENHRVNQAYIGQISRFRAPRSIDARQN